MRWSKAMHDDSPAARMGVLLALRRLEDPAIAGFLSDPDPRSVLEAARAINDVPITAAFAGSGRGSRHFDRGLPLLRRVLNANFRLGRAEHAALVAEFGRAFGPASRGPDAGPGDAGRVGQALGARQGDGAMATDRAPFAVAGRRRPAAQAGVASAARPRRRFAPRPRTPPRPSASRRPEQTWRRSPPIAKRPT